MTYRADVPFMEFTMAYATSQQAIGLKRAMYTDMAILDQWVRICGVRDCL